MGTHNVTLRNGPHFFRAEANLASPLLTEEMANCPGWDGSIGAGRRAPKRHIEFEFFWQC